MFVLHVQGLSLCVFDKKRSRLRVCCLNSGFVDSDDIPVHLQTLVAERAAVTTFDPVPLRTTKGRLRNQFNDQIHLAWDLLEHHVVVSGGNGLPEPIQPDLPAHHPDPNAPDWSALHWVMSADNYLPGAVLNPGTLEIGPRTSAIIDVTGGKCYGGQPETTQSDSNYLFWFGSGVDRAATDTMLIVFDDPPLVEVRNSADQSKGNITFIDGNHAWLINEATDRDIANEKKAFEGQKARHMFGYFPAFDKLPHTNLPVRLTQWRHDANEVDGTFCIILRTEI